MKNFSKITILLPLILLVFFSSHAKEQGQSRGYFSVTYPSIRAEQLYTKSLVAMENGNSAKALFLLNQTLKADSSFFMGNFQLILYDLINGDQNSLKNHVTHALKNREKLSRGEQLLFDGLSRLENKTGRSLLNAAHELVLLFPEDKQAWNILASLQVIYRMHKDALVTYRKLLEISDNKAAVYNRIGYILLFMENFKEAEKAFNKYIEFNPDQPNPWDSKGDYFMELKEFEQAYSCYMRAFSLNEEWSHEKAMKAKWKSLSGQY